MPSKRSKGTYTWEEIQRKDGKTDPEKWIVIDDEVYNVTNWGRKHPGGSRVISHYAGQDASEVFVAFHKDQKYSRKFMTALHIGEVASTDKSRNKSIVDDVKNLRQTAQKMGLFKPSKTFYLVQILHILLLAIVAYAEMSYFGVTVPTFIFAIVILGTAQAQCAWLQHDFGHNSVFEDNKFNRLVHFLIMGTLKGASSKWWNHMHNQHHSKPNVIDKDPDVRLEALFVVGEKMPVAVAKSGKSSMPYNHQHKYFTIIGPPLLFPVYFQFMLFWYIFSRKEWTDLCFTLSFYVLFGATFGNLLSWWQVILLYEGMRVLESIWFTWVAQSNHIPMEIDKDMQRPWLELQLRATCNIEKSAFNDWFTGHLNFQIEHHIFPSMPRHNLHRITPLVKSICKKHGIEYRVKTLGEGFADILRSLHKSGQIWFDAYYHLRHDL
ncbi:acyl-CoA (8-3)-desaturase-like [Anneissia japonica]|uniref:acyl-CoA (8-3)-desaturase-like n=1 Tax=Anneissia japonica TaxID=1529436 RepID=UPI0014257E02|nr:acyl-CoA (8-3)-desaturase-like [Anneissia japonica]XP_033127954.1 acyl-CoA (8-3)-desaturase-like [Anneissia japonica]XP_033127955.1 acyl-CoA (8-3)-desaturase-like [Anneissia japonica]